jgi:predicted nucleic acid-binding protein
MERVFADTGYWIALLNPRDDLHQKASATSRDYTLNQIVTSEMVLTEFLNSFSDYGPGSSPSGGTGGRVASRHGPDRHRPSNRPAF